MEAFSHIARHGLQSLYQVVGLGYAVLLTDARGIAVDFIGDLQIEPSLRNAATAPSTALLAAVTLNRAYEAGPIRARQSRLRFHGAGDRGPTRRQRGLGLTHESPHAPTAHGSPAERRRNARTAVPCQTRGP